LASVRVFAGNAWNELTIGWIAPTSIVILIAYLVGQRLIFRFEQRRMAQVFAEHAQTYAHITTRRAVAIFFGAALAIVGLGIWLSFLGDEIARDRTRREFCWQCISRDHDLAPRSRCYDFRRANESG
jgi:hypothetical protein